MRDYFVYIMSSRTKTLYAGVTNDLERRVAEHKQGAARFTSRFKITKFVYYETLPSAQDAIRREKQIKGWLRRKKIALIESVNPEWDDLSEGWYQG